MSKVAEHEETAMTAAETDQAVPAQAKAEKTKAAQTAPKKGQEKAAGFCCYIGPNLKHLIQTGTIFKGTREQALEQAAQAIQANPLVKTLIVSGDTLARARVQVRTPGNMLYDSYKKLAGKEKRNG